MSNCMQDTDADGGLLTAHLLHDIVQHKSCSKPTGDADFGPGWVGSLWSSIARGMTGAVCVEPANIDLDFVPHCLLGPLQRRDGAC